MYMSQGGSDSELAPIATCIMGFANDIWDFDTQVRNKEDSDSELAPLETHPVYLIKWISKSHEQLNRFTVLHEACFVLEYFYFGYLMIPLFPLNFVSHGQLNHSIAFVKLFGQ